MPSFPVWVQVTSSRIPLAAAQASCRRFSAVASPRRRHPRSTAVRPCSALVSSSFQDEQPGVADDAIAVQGDDRSAGQCRLVAEPLVQRDRDASGGEREVGVALRGHGVGALEQRRVLGYRRECDALVRRRRRLVRDDDPHLLHLSIRFDEPVPERERDRSRLGRVRDRRVEAGGAQVLEQPLEQRAAHTATAVLGQDARCDEAAARVRPRREPAPGELAVQLGKQEQPIRRLQRAHLLDVAAGSFGSTSRRTRIHASRSASALHRPDGDHPDRLSFPCFFACCSPRRKIASPTGAATAPITSSGQISSHIVERPSPSRIAPRIPSSA